MFGTLPKIGFTLSLLLANMIAKLKAEKELKSIQILSNENKNKEVNCDLEEYDENQIIEKQTNIN